MVFDEGMGRILVVKELVFKVMMKIFKEKVKVFKEEKSVSFVIELDIVFIIIIIWLDVLVVFSINFVVDIVEKVIDLIM